MSELKIQCPKCSNEIELTEQLAGPMLADLRSSFNDELAKREAQSAKDQRNRYKIGEDIHFSLPRRSAFSDTVIDELDIASAAISGVARPAIANGTAMIL